MPKVKEVVSAKYGKILTATTQERRILYCLQDICKLFVINLQEARMKIGNDKVVEISFSKESKTVKKLFIGVESIDDCLKLSNDERSDIIYEWLREIDAKATVIFHEYTVEDLKNEEIAYEVLNRLKELETKVAVYQVKLEEDKEKVELVDKLYGTKLPIDISIVAQRIKYRNLSLASILEDLRVTGIFNSDNMPNQKYVDSRHFRLVTVTTTINAETVVATKVLVYQKGIRLIEEILRKKAGRQNGTNK